MGAMELSMELHSMLGEAHRVPATLLFNHPTVNGIVDFVEDAITITVVPHSNPSQHQMFETNVVIKVLPAGGAVVMDVYNPTFEHGEGLRPAIICAHGCAYGGGHYTASELGATEAEAADEASVFNQLAGQNQFSKDHPSAVLSGEELCAQGFVVFVVGYRQSRFVDSVDDIASAVEWVQQPINAARFNVDPDRVGMYGQSSGGHAVMMAGIQLRAGGGRGVKALATVACQFGVVAGHSLFELATRPTSFFATRTLGVQMGAGELGKDGLKQALAPLSVTASVARMGIVPALHMLSVYSSADKVVPISTSGADTFEAIISQQDERAESATSSTQCEFETVLLDRPDLDHMTLINADVWFEQAIAHFQLHL